VLDQQIDQHIARAALEALHDAPELLAHQVQRRSQGRSRTVAECGHDADGVDAQAEPVQKLLEVVGGLVFDQDEDVEDDVTCGKQVAQNRNRAGQGLDPRERDPAAAHAAQPRVDGCSGGVGIGDVDLVQRYDRHLAFGRFLFVFLYRVVSHIGTP
jgi:hypothetical protein